MIRTAFFPIDFSLLPSQNVGRRAHGLANAIVEPFDQVFRRRGRFALDNPLRELDVPPRNVPVKEVDAPSERERNEAGPIPLRFKRSVQFRLPS